MSGEQQKSQMKLAFMSEGEVKSSISEPEGTEPRVANSESEGPAYGNELMEEVCRPENVQAAVERVRKNRGGPGIDGMTVDRLGKHLDKHWPEIRDSLLKGTYKPQPVKRVEIPKPDGGVRKLGIPTVQDRMVQQAIMQVLQRKWDPTFSEHSYGFRPNRSAQEAVMAAQAHVAEGYEWVVDIDLEKFFDRVNHDRLMSQLAKRIGDKRMLKIIRRFLSAGVMDEGLVQPTNEGTPQGGPLSPLLSNIVLDELDRELERRGHRFVRYADDCNIYVKSERAGHRVMETVRKFITKKLKLKVNDEKSKVDKPAERTFLGFRLAKWSNGETRIEVAPKSIDRFKRRLREITRRVRRISWVELLLELNGYLRGWFQYFGLAEDRSVWTRLDKWIRRRLRSLIWTQWKTRAQRYKMLRRRGVDEETARKNAGSSKGSWAMSKSPALSAAITNDYLHNTHGLFSLSART